ncbi:hypothetical protein JCM4914_32440 [Streptomyces platensis subsp. malvinus]
MPLQASVSKVGDPDEAAARWAPLPKMGAGKPVHRPRADRWRVHQPRADRWRVHRPRADRWRVHQPRATFASACLQ